MESVWNVLMKNASSIAKFQHPSMHSQNNFATILRLTLRLLTGSLYLLFLDHLINEVEKWLTMLSTNIFHIGYLARSVWDCGPDWLSGRKVRFNKRS